MTHAGCFSGHAASRGAGCLSVTARNLRNTKTSPPQRPAITTTEVTLTPISAARSEELLTAPAVDAKGDGEDEGDSSGVGAELDEGVGVADGELPSDGVGVGDMVEESETDGEPPAVTVGEGVGDAVAEREGDCEAERTVGYDCGAYTRRPWRAML